MGNAAPVIDAALSLARNTAKAATSLVLLGQIDAVVAGLNTVLSGDRAR